MNLESIYERKSPWPQQDSPQVLFLLDTSNSLERDVLSGWIGHHSPRAENEQQAPQTYLDLRDDRKGFDSTPLLMALALPAETIITPVRLAWLPAEDPTKSGARFRNLVLGDPRRPNKVRGKKILAETPQRAQLIAGVPDTIANLRQRYELHHAINIESAQTEFADFIARQAAIVLDIAERQLQGGRYKVPRHVAATLLASPAYNKAVEKIASEQGKDKEELLKDAAVYMQEMVSVPRRFWLDFYARFNSFCLGLGYEEKIVYDQAAVEKMRQVVRNNPSMLLWT